MKTTITILFSALCMALSAQTVTLDITWRDTTVIGKDMTYAQAKARWPAWVGYMEYIGASSRVLNIRKAVASHNNAVWANDDYAGVTYYQNGCGSRANIIWPAGVFQIDAELIRPQGIVSGGGTGGFWEWRHIDNDKTKPLFLYFGGSGGTTLIYDHAGWDGVGNHAGIGGDASKRFIFKDMTWGNTNNFGYTEGSQLQGFKIWGRSNDLHDPSYHFSGVGVWKAGEDYMIQDVFIYNCNNYGIEMGGQFHATYYSERVSIFKCGIGGIGVEGGAHMQVHMGSYDDNPTAFHVYPGANGSIGNGTSIKCYGTKFETGKTDARPYSRGQLLVDGEGWIKFDAYGTAYSRVNTKPHVLFRIKSVGAPNNGAQESRVALYGTTWFYTPAYLLHDRVKGQIIPMDQGANYNGVNSRIIDFLWTSERGVIESTGQTLTPIAATCDGRLAPAPIIGRDANQNPIYKPWSGCSPAYSFTAPIQEEGGPVIEPPPTPTPCTYTTGPWGECINGTQVRTVTSSPAGCTGTAPNTTQPCTIVVTPPPPTTPGAINPADVLVVVNTADPTSAAMASAYTAAWGIPAANVVSVNLGAADDLTTAATLTAARTTINSRGKQYTVLAFSKPSRYGSQSITSAITFGARSVSSLTASPLYNYTGTKPRTDKGVAPSFLLVDAKYIRAGVTKNGAVGNSYMILAKDQSGTPRGSARASQTATGLNVWDYRNVSGVGEGSNGCNQLSMSCWITGRIPSLPILAYYGSMNSLGNADGIVWRSGYYGDHVTSYGGFLPGNSTYTNSKGQTALTWHLNRGASMSVGSVSEPWQGSGGSLAQQFVNVSIFHPQFIAGTPVGIAAWSAVQSPDRMLFAGDPLYQTR